MKRIKILCLTLVMACFSSLSIAAEQTEKPIPDETQAAESDSAMRRIEGQVEGYEILTVAGQPLAAAVQRAAGDPYGAILMLHDQGEQIDSQNFITVLRHSLPKQGWTTLTIELDFPIEPNILLSASLEEKTEAGETDETKEAVEDKAAEEEADNGSDGVAKEKSLSNQQRIEGAVAYLQTQDITDVIILGHGQGGISLFEIVDDMTPKPLGLILINTPKFKLSDKVKAMETPLLDIYGDRSSKAVIKAANVRKVEMKQAENTFYTMRKVSGADSAFYGFESNLLSTVRGWLYKQFIEPEKEKEKEK